MSADKIPHIVKHCTLAIWRDGGISGGKRERFVSAWNIARARLTEYGFLAPGSAEGPVDNIKLTSKGTTREAFHAREPGGKTKSNLFDQMYKWIDVAQETVGDQEEPETKIKPLNATQADRGDLDAEKHNVARARALLNPVQGKKHGAKYVPKDEVKKGHTGPSKLGGAFKPYNPFGKKPLPPKS